MALINCKECGQKISDAAKTCPHCGAPVIKDVYCPKCGRKVPENIMYCPDCGTSISSSTAGYQFQKNDKTLTGILAIVLGGLGIHYFYLGKNTAGILTIIITFFCFIWWIVMIIQGILILTMSEEDFRAKYIDTDKTFPIF